MDFLMALIVLLSSTPETRRETLRAARTHPGCDYCGRLLWPRLKPDACPLCRFSREKYYPGEEEEPS